MRMNPFAGPLTPPGNDTPKDETFQKVMDGLKTKRPPRPGRPPKPSPRPTPLPPIAAPPTPPKPEPIQPEPPRCGTPPPPPFCGTPPPFEATTLAVGEEGPIPIEPGIGDDKPLPIEPVGPPQPAPGPIGVCPPPDVKPGPIIGPITGPITWPKPRPDDPIMTTMAVGEEGGPLPKPETFNGPGGAVGARGPFLIEDPAPPRDLDRSATSKGSNNDA